MPLTRRARRERAHRQGRARAGVLVSLWRSLTVRTRLHKQRKGRWRHDNLVPWTVTNDADTNSFVDLVQRNEGVAFAPTTTPPGRDRPFITILNDAAGDADDRGESYRGGAMWLVGAPTQRTQWSQAIE